MKYTGKTMAWGLRGKNGIIRSQTYAWKREAEQMTTVDDVVIRVYVTSVK